MSQKIPNNFVCVLCDYRTSSRKDFAKHERTRKHALSVGYNQIQLKSPQFLCECGRAYKHRGSLHNHKKTCTVVHSSISAGIKGADANSSTENAWLREQVAEMRELVKMMIPNIGDRVIKDNKIAVNVFLNEQCKDAINFDDFVDRISVSLDDLELTKQIGYSQGVSNILIRHLKNMEATDRPIHCSDRAHMRFYVKQMQGWDEDGGETVGTAIASITQKQIATIKMWEAQYPNWHHNPHQTEEYAMMVRRVMGGSTDEEVERNRVEIIRNVSGAVSLDTAIADSSNSTTDDVNAKIPYSAVEMQDQCYSGE